MFVLKLTRSYRFEYNKLLMMKLRNYFINLQINLLNGLFGKLLGYRKP